MADEIRVAREEGTGPRPVGGEVRPTPVDPERQLPAEAATAGAVPDYEDPEQARADIEATRARMSETIDEIEGALIRRKEQIQDRLDVLAPIRENPFMSMGAAFGSGLLFGLLTGGDDEDDDDRYSTSGWERGRDDDHYWERRAGMWKDRSHRLLEIARAQEEELEALREDRSPHHRSRRRKGWSSWLEDGDDEYDVHYEPDFDVDEEDGFLSQSTLENLKESVSGGVSSLVSAFLREFVAPARRAARGS